jgi:hypothetical protein
MINFRRWRIATAAAILTILAGSVAVPAAACPLDPEPAPHRSIAFPDSRRTRPAVHPGTLTSRGDST